MTSSARTRHIAAPPDRAWQVLADFGALASWVPMIQHSCLLSEQTAGVGTVRRVQIATQTLVERVDTWEPGATLSYSIEGLPPFVGSARNTWVLAPTASGTDVTLTTELDPGSNPIKSLIAKKVLERMSTASEFMLAGLDAAATRDGATDRAEAST